MSQPCLLFQGTLVPLTGRTDFIVGRDERICQVLLRNENVSRRHARINVRDNRCSISDLNSTNGTYVNGRRITAMYALEPGDEITIRPFKLLFVVAGLEAELSFAEQVQESEAGAHRKSKGHFSGVLDSVSIADLVQFLGSAPESGILTIRDSDKFEGKLIIIDGEIVDADYLGKRGEQAVYALMGLQEADFEFEECKPPMPEKPIGKSTISLLLEACRLHDEFGQKTQPIPLTDTSGDATR